MAYLYLIYYIMCIMYTSRYILYRFGFGFRFEFGFGFSSKKSLPLFSMLNAQAMFMYNVYDSIFISVFLYRYNKLLLHLSCSLFLHSIFHNLFRLKYLFTGKSYVKLFLSFSIHFDASTSPEFFF